MRGAVGAARRRGAAGAIALLAVGRSAGAVEPEEVLVERARLAEEEGATVVEVGDRPTSDDLASVLRAVPGLTVRSLGGVGAWSGVSVRGSSYRQVLVHLDGVPLNPDGVDAVNLAEIPLAALSELRIWRGLAPVRYGAGAMGGVIDLVSPEAPRSAPVVRLGVGSLHTVRASGSVGAPVGAGGDGLLAVDALHTEGDFLYFSDAGTRFVPGDDAWRLRANNDKLQVAAHGRWRQRFGDWRLSLLEAAVVRREGLPGPIGDPARAVKLDTMRSLTTLSLTGLAGPVGVSARGWYLGRRDALDDRGGELGVGASHGADGFHTAGLWSSLSGEPLPWLALTGLVHGRWEQYRARDLLTGEVGEPRARAVVGSAVEASARWWQDRAALSLALDTRGVAAGEASSWSGLLPRGTLAVQVHEGLLVRAQAGATFRAPTLTELYGDRGAVVGNPNLRPERASAVELTLLGRSPARPFRVEAELAGFVRWARDLVVYVQNSQRTMVPQSFGRARVMGVEAALGLQLGPYVHSRTGLTLQDPRNRVDDPAVFGRLLPSTPRSQFDQQTTISYGERVVVSHQLHHLGATFYDATNWLIAAPRWLHDLHLRVRPWVVGPELELSLLNLTNVRTHEVGIDPLQPGAGTMPTAVTDLVGYPLPGRTVMGSIVWRPLGRGEGR